VRADNPPTFAPTIPNDHIEGTTLRKPHSQQKKPHGVEHRRPHHM
jgi:hypothetical protein